MKNTKEKIAAQTVLTAIMKNAKPFLKVSDLEIVTSDDYSKAALLMSNLKQLAKQAEEQKQTIVQPIKKALEAINEHFRPFLEQVKAIELDTKQKMTEFIDLQEQRSEHLLNQFEQGKIHKLETLVQKQAELKDLDNSNASVRKVKEVEIIAIKKIPQKYLVPDLIAIKKDLLAGKTVPGAVLKFKTSIAI